MPPEPTHFSVEKPAQKVGYRNYYVLEEGEKDMPKPRDDRDLERFSAEYRDKLEKKMMETKPTSANRI